jgi:hypothetical protein
MTTSKSLHAEEEVVPIEHNERVTDSQGATLKPLQSNMGQSFDTEGEVTREATGKDLPPGYFRSKNFLGTLMVGACLVSTPGSDA